MNAAFGFLMVCPAPAARIAAVSNGLRAVQAANAGIPPVMKVVVRQIVSADIRPDHLLRPVGEGAQFDHVVACVPFDDGCISPAPGLVAPQASHPRAVT